MNDIEDLKNSITIPKEIDLAVEQGIERGRREKLKNNKPKLNKFIIKAALLALVFTTTIFIVKPDLVKAIPGVGSIFKKFSNGFSGELMPKFENFSTSVNKTIEKNGVKVTIDEIAIDDNMIAVTSTIEGKNLDKNKIDMGPITINGDYLESWSNNTEMINSDKLEVITYGNIAEMKLSNEVEVEMKINMVWAGDVQGPWDYKFTVSKEKSSKLSKTVQINKKFDLPNSTVEFKDIVMSPFGNTLNIRRVCKNIDSENVIGEVKEYIMLDESGNMLMTKPSGGSSNKGIYEEKLEILGDLSKSKNITIIPILEEKGTISKEINKRSVSILQCTINSDDFQNTPQENIVNKRSVTEKEKKDGYSYDEVINSYNIDKGKKFVNIEKLIGQKIQVNDISNVEIRNIELNDNNTKIAFKINGDYDYQEINEVTILDEDYKDISRAEDGARAKIEDVQDRIVSIELPPIDKNKKYKIALPVAANPVIEEKYKLNVDLK